MLDDLRYLISLKTFHDNKENENEFEEAWRYIQKRCETISIPFRRVEKNGYTSAIIGNEQKADVILFCHIDVVAAPDELFDMKINGDEIRGRGAIDMKYAIAVSLKLYTDFPDFRKKLAVIITSDEETGGENGTKFIVEEVLKKMPKVFIVPDGGYNFNLEFQAKGVLQIKITKKGESAHGSMPWNGINSIEYLVQSLTLLRNTYPLPKSETFDLTINIGKICGGNAANQVCDHAEVYLDIRYKNNQELEKFMQDLKKYFSGCKIEVIAKADIFETDKSHELMDRWVLISEEIIGRKIEFIKSFAATDARYLTNLKIPVILTVPSGGGWHGNDEWISLSALKDFYKILARYMNGI